jgi:hypothetical protein
MVEGTSTIASAEPEARNELARLSKPITLGCLGLLGLHMLLRYAPTMASGEWPKDGGLDAVALAIAACAALPALAPLLTSAKLPGGIELQFRELRLRQSLSEVEIKQLRLVVEGFVTDGELAHLRNIQRKVAYTVRAEDVPVVDGELRRLLALGLIRRRGGNLGVRTFVVADGKARDIATWFELTPRGLEYLAMRAQATEGEVRPK